MSSYSYFCIFQLFAVRTKHIIICFILETTMLRSTLLILVLCGFVLAVSGSPYRRKKFYRDYSIIDS